MITCVQQSWVGPHRLWSELHSAVSVTASVSARGPHRRGVSCSAAASWLLLAPDWSIERAERLPVREIALIGFSTKHICMRGEKEKGKPIESVQHLTHWAPAAPNLVHPPAQMSNLTCIFISAAHLKEEVCPHTDRHFQQNQQVYTTFLNANLLIICWWLHSIFSGKVISIRSVTLLTSRFTSRT